ncbi:hypothetical protein BY458DRAFT_217451 [Sporodiniella umbellata]|nr:hypothetical protein BY458DRAFT_217451 [Sporodiniella umbellata]
MKKKKPEKKQMCLLRILWLNTAISIIFFFFFDNLYLPSDGLGYLVKRSTQFFSFLFVIYPLGVNIKSFHLVRRSQDCILKRKKLRQGDFYIFERSRGQQN